MTKDFPTSILIDVDMTPNAKWARHVNLITLIYKRHLIMNEKKTKSFKANF
jgi:hypothetical protein